MQVDAREWQLELERVTPQLRVQVANADANEWRSHVEQARKSPPRAVGCPFGLVRRIRSSFQMCFCV